MRLRSFSLAREKRSVLALLTSAYGARDSALAFAFGECEARMRRGARSASLAREEIRRERRALLTREIRRRAFSRISSLAREMRRERTHAPKAQEKRLISRA